MDRRSVLKLAGSTFGLVAAGGVAAATPGRNPGPNEDEILVGVSAGAGRPADFVGDHLPAEANLVHGNETLRYVAVAFGGNDHARERFLAALDGDRRVKYAEPNGTLHAQYTPDDPRFSDQYVPQQTNADAAWDTTLGDTSVTVAVVDNGVQYDHEDLSSQFGTDEGYDFADGDSDPYPDDLSIETHGTNVAGIASATTDNGTGLAGISNSRLLSARALDENGAGSLSDVADAITWAADQGADVINLSLGASSGSSTLKNAVEYAYDQGSYLVGSAGGNGPCDGDCVAYPAKYDEVVAVSAVDDDGNLASFSSTGSSVELTAPGVDVRTTTTTPNGDYSGPLSGTSFAAAAVSGVAGLALARWDVDNVTLREHLNATARDVGLSSDEQGNGHVDAGAAVSTHPGGVCGATSTTTTASDYLDGYWDSDCWYWTWEYSDPCQVVVELDGPSDADFDLYANEGTGSCPDTSTYTHRSFSTNSQETITIDDPDTSAPLYVLVDSWSGSGSYDLTFTEKTT